MKRASCKERNKIILKKKKYLKEKREDERIEEWKQRKKCKDGRE